MMSHNDIMFLYKQYDLQCLNVEIQATGSEGTEVQTI